MVLLFADTKMEDEDLYRFLEESSKNIGAPLIKIKDGRNPWEVFDDVKLIGSSFADPCSLHLKRSLLDKWIKRNCSVKHTTIHFGIDWTELHRYERLIVRKMPWRVAAYMTEPPLMSKDQMINWAISEGIKPPRLYGMGFSHNNCGGFCIKSGQAQFALLLRKMPLRYKWHEDQEQAFLEKHKVPQAVLHYTECGKKRRMTLKEFRERIESQMTFDENDWGGCGCAVDS